MVAEGPRKLKDSILYCYQFRPRKVGNWQKRLTHQGTVSLARTTPPFRCWGYSLLLSRSCESVSQLNRVLEDQAYPDSLFLEQIDDLDVVSTLLLINHREFDTNNSIR